jgi:hypothetical protein
MLVLTSYVVRDFAVFRLVDRQSINEQAQPVCAEGCFISIYSLLLASLCLRHLTVNMAASGVSSGSNEALDKMEVLGYAIIPCTSPNPPELINAVISTAQPLYSSTPSNRVCSLSLRGGVECDQFLTHGIDVSSHAIVKRIFILFFRSMI